MTELSSDFGCYNLPDIMWSLHYVLIGGMRKIREKVQISDPEEKRNRFQDVKWCELWGQLAWSQENIQLRAKGNYHT